MRKTTTIATGVFAALAVAATGPFAGQAAAASYVRASMMGFDMTVYGASDAKIAFQAYNQLDRDLTCGWTIDGKNQPAFEITKGSKGSGYSTASYGDHAIAIRCQSYQENTLIAPKYRVKGSGTVTVPKPSAPVTPPPPATPKQKQLKPMNLKPAPAAPQPAPDPISTSGTWA